MDLDQLETGVSAVIDDMHPISKMNYANNENLENVSSNECLFTTFCLKWVKYTKLSCKIYLQVGNVRN